MSVWERSREYAAAKREYKQNLKLLSPADREHHEACVAVDRDIAVITERLASSYSRVLASYHGGIPGRFLAGIFVNEDMVFLPEGEFPLEHGLSVNLFDGGHMHEYSMNRSRGNTALRRTAANMLLPGVGNFVNDQRAVTFDSRDLAFEFDSESWNYYQPLKPDDRMAAFSFISEIKNVVKNLSRLRYERDQAVSFFRSELEGAQNVRHRMGTDPCPKPVRR